MIKSIVDIIGSWEVDIKTLFARLILGLCVLFIFYIIGKLSKGIAYKINSRVLSKYKDLQTLLSKLIYYFFLLIGVYICLQIIGLEQYFVKILAGAGIVGIIAGFALKDIASNTFSGILLFLEKPYKKGDWVQIDGHYGKILHVGLISTIMVNRTGQEVYIANQLIYSGVFINYSTYQKRGVRIQTDIVQSLNVEIVKSVLEKKITLIKNFSQNQQILFYANAITSSGNLSVELFFLVNFNNEFDHLNTISEIIRCIKLASLESGVALINTKWISDEIDNTSIGDYGAG